MPDRPSQPRYQSVADAIQARIRDGGYAVGDALPTEQELCGEYGVSRYTVREALRRLVQQGLVRRRQGSGTEVIAAVPPAAYLHAMRSLSELFEYASDTRLDVTRMALETPGPEMAAALGRKPGRRWLCLDGVRRTRHGVPISFTRIWIHEDFAALGPDIPGHVGPIYQMLEQRFGVLVEEVVQEITAEPIPADAAEALGAEPGSPAVRLLRRYLGDADQPLIASASWHKAEGFRYAMRLRREEAGP